MKQNKTTSSKNKKSIINSVWPYIIENVFYMPHKSNETLSDGFQNNLLVLKLLEARECCHEAKCKIQTSSRLVGWAKKILQSQFATPLRIFVQLQVITD